MTTQAKRNAKKARRQLAGLHEDRRFHMTRPVMFCIHADGQEHPAQPEDEQDAVDRALQALDHADQQLYFAARQFIAAYEREEIEHRHGDGLSVEHAIDAMGHRFADRIGTGYLLEHLGYSGDGHEHQRESEGQEDELVARLYFIGGPIDGQYAVFPKGADPDDAVIHLVVVMNEDFPYRTWDQVEGQVLDAFDGILPPDAYPNAILSHSDGKWRLTRDTDVYNSASSTTEGGPDEPPMNGAVEELRCALGSEF